MAAALSCGGILLKPGSGKRCAVDVAMEWRLSDPWVPPGDDGQLQIQLQQVASGGDAAVRLFPLVHHEVANLASASGPFKWPRVADEQTVNHGVAGVTATMVYGFKHVFPDLLQLV